MCGFAVMYEEGVELAEHTSLWCSSVECDEGGDVATLAHCLWSVGEKVQNPVTQVCVFSPRLFSFMANMIGGWC